MQPATGLSPTGTQSPNVTSCAIPLESEIAPLPKDKHKLSPVGLPETENKTPSPTGIVAPVNEKPSIVLPPVETVKPALAAVPPDTLMPLSPVKSN